MSEIVCSFSSRYAHLKSARFIGAPYDVKLIRDILKDGRIISYRYMRECYTRENIVDDNGLFLKLLQGAYEATMKERTEIITFAVTSLARKS